MGRSVLVVGGVDDLGNNDVGDAISFLLADAVILAKFGAYVTGDDAG